MLVRCGIGSSARKLSDCVTVEQVSRSVQKWENQFRAYLFGINLKSYNCLENSRHVGFGSSSSLDSSWRLNISGVRFLWFHLDGDLRNHAAFSINMQSRLLTAWKKCNSGRKTLWILELWWSHFVKCSLIWYPCCTGNSLLKGLVQLIVRLD